MNFSNTDIENTKQNIHLRHRKQTKDKKTYENVTEESDAVALLKLVKTVPMGMEGEGTS